MTLPVSHLDIESRSACDLKSAGLYRYFEDDTTEVLVVRWRIGGGPVHELGDGHDHEIAAHIEEGGTVAGHNIAFDREGWNTKVAPLRGLPLISVEQTDCTMARCNALAVPGGLEQAGKALSLKITKDVEGHRLMMRMCKPKTSAPLTWHETPEQLARLSEYCATDVLSECEIDRVVPKLSAAEKRVWVLDQTINARGVQLDVPMVSRALAVAELAQIKASAQIYDLTGGAVERCTQGARLLRWLQDRGIDAVSMAKGETEDLLIRSDLFGDDLARQVIELRTATAKSSVAKYKAMANSVCKDGRVRGTLAYHGATTGRWAGRLIQPQNLPRILDKADDVLLLHTILLENDDPEAAYALCAMVWENPLDILSKALRSMIVAAPGKKLVGGDYSNIEGRVNAWLAGEDWKVKAFADFDAGEGVDLYVLAYAKAFGVSTDAVDKLLRQQGKVTELALGYQGGVRAFQKMAAGYGMLVSDERADELKVAWREAHPAIVSSWYELQDAAIAAVKNPGMKVPCLSGRICYRVASGILWCLLPSGRVLSYVAPRIEAGTCPTCKGVGTIWEVKPDPAKEIEGVEIVCTDCRGEKTVRPRVAFMGVDSKTKQWRLQRLYGGLQCENVVQAIARDVMVEAMFRLEATLKEKHPDGEWRAIVSEVELADGTVGPAAVMREFVVDGYRIVLSVHDELITEVPEDFGSPEELAGLMAVVPEWAEGLPVAVEAWDCERYIK